MLIKINRDSVCMGDDVFDHKGNFEINDDSKLSDLVKKIYEVNYLPHISGGVATWIVTTKNINLVIITQSEDFIYIHSENEFVKNLFDDDKKEIHLRYCLQNSMKDVFDSLQSL